MKKTLLAITAALVFTGCSTTAPLNFSVPNVAHSTNRIEANLKAMTVSIAGADAKSAQLDDGMDIVVPQLWQAALQESVTKMAIFKEDAPAKVNLAVKIVNVDIPHVGFTFVKPAATEARYELQDSTSGSVIYAQNIVSRRDSSKFYDFKTPSRAREAMNRSVQDNIAQFLHALEGADLSKSLAPAVSAR